MYAIIGAGPAGLAAARNLDRQGLPFVGFELHGDVGGLWDIANPHSTMYRSAHLISSKRKTEFAEFPMPGDMAPYPRHDAMKRYFQDYARHFDLVRHYRFGTRVTAVERVGTGWKITSEKGGAQTEDTFDGVLIASGTLHTPNAPRLPGDFSGRLMHSCDYRDADVFAGQRVLIVGCGNSACDIAVDAVHRARSVDLSVRRGYYFVPKFIAGRPSDTFGGRLQLPRWLKQRLDAALLRFVVGKPSDYGLPDPDYRMYESHPVMNTLVLNHLGHGDIRPRGAITQVNGSTVTFADGAAADYDLILQATGYRLDYPFIDRQLLNWQGDAPRLFLNIFHPEYDNLFMLGMVEAAGLGWEGRNQQALLVALYLKHAHDGHPAARRIDELRRDPASAAVDGGYHYLKVARMAYYVHKESYLKALAGHVRAFGEAAA